MLTLGGTSSLFNGVSNGILTSGLAGTLMGDLLAQATGGGYAMGSALRPIGRSSTDISESYNYPGVKIIEERGGMVGLSDRGYFDEKTSTIHIPVIQNGIYREAYIQHEYGHYLQLQEYGEERYSIFKHASSRNAAYDIITGSQTHDRFWTETSANRLSSKYFGPKAPISSGRYSIYFPKY
jgi:hypothetical protein